MNARQERARELAGVILRVRSGAITATEGARMLGISRKNLLPVGEESALGNDVPARTTATGETGDHINPEMEAMRRR